MSTKVLLLLALIGPILILAAGVRTARNEPESPDKYKIRSVYWARIKHGVRGLAKLKSSGCHGMSD